MTLTTCDSSSTDKRQKVRLSLRATGRAKKGISKVKATSNRRKTQAARRGKSPAKAIAKETYGPSPIKRTRRAKSEIARLRQVVAEVVEIGKPMTVRQVFYQLVNRREIHKTEAEYKRTICRLLAEMRRAGEIPFDWIADNTRWMRKPRTFSSLETMLRHTRDTYRRALWDNQLVYVEIWLEKDALSGVLYQETAKWDVPLMPTRGYPSLSFLYSAAEAIEAESRPVFIYYLGDHDPSGLDIPRKIESDLRTFAPSANISFERVAVTPEQIEHFRLPTRPTKTSDTRAKSFAGESVEVDALDPGVLRGIVAACIERHVDRDALAALRRTENLERQTLDTVVSQFAAGG